MRYLSVFDLDRTLLSTNSSYRFAQYLFEKGIFSSYHLVYSLFHRVRFELLDLSLREFHESLFRGVLQGAVLEEIEAHVEGFLERCLPRRVYYPAYSALRLAQHLGHHTAILSNAPQFLVRPFARYFGVDFGQGTEYEVDKDGCLCNIANLMEGTAKARCLVEMREGLKISRENTIAYTDSYHDLPLLLEAGQPCVVNPDTKLLRLAKHHRWSVI